MKCLEASRFGGPDVLRVVEKETPQPGEGILLVENDYPYEDYAEGGEFIDTVPISESDRRKIAYDNAKALYML
jgi:hypothetical protein